jgi:hypothetical protein
MHIRRGDYLVHRFALPFSFYEAALKELMEVAQFETLVVTSDDEEFARLAADHFSRFGIATTTRGAKESRSDLKEFYLLATAQYLIMSNSTFAWWAAVLGDRLRDRERVVICPMPWMPPRPATAISDRLDLARSEWRLIDWRQQQPG